MSQEGTNLEFIDFNLADGQIGMQRRCEPSEGVQGGSWLTWLSHRPASGRTHFSLLLSEFYFVFIFRRPLLEAV